MGNGHLRIPSWCTFGAAVVAVVLVCIISIRMGEAEWTSKTSNVYNAGETYTETRLEPWELDTTVNYAPTLSDTASRSQPPQLRYYEFQITSQATYIGGVHRELLVINGKYPGPLIEAVEGDTVIVNVRNNIETSDIASHRVTSLHFHGQLMNGTNFYDGSIGLTQCGISPGTNFTYVFVADQSGTYWYHSHWDLQQVEGLVGPMVIHERVKINAIDLDQDQEHDRNNDGLKTQGGTKIDGDIPYENGESYEREHSDESRRGERQKSKKPREQQEAVLLLSDLYNRPAVDLLLDYMEPWIGGSEEPVPNIALVQGKRQPIIAFPTGGRVRLRIINACSYTAFNVKLAGSYMTVVEADSTPTLPTLVESLLVYPAQRYSVIIDLEKGTGVWLYTTPQTSLYGRDSDLSQSLRQSSAALKTLLMAGNRTATDTLTIITAQLNEEELTEPHFQPLDLEIRGDRLHADLESIVDITMTRLESGEVAGALNSQIHQIMPAGNVLQAVLDNSARSQKRTVEILEPKSRAKVLLQFDAIKTVDLVVRNYDDGPHPVHLHGHRVWVISRGHVDSMIPYWRPSIPLKRDTVWLPEDQWVRIRFIVDNPGVWAIHCHIPWHSRIGMKGTILALPSKLAEQKPPSDWYELCRV